MSTRTRTSTKVVELSPTKQLSELRKSVGAQLMVVTPKQATEWLTPEVNSENRRASRATVDAYAKDMAAGLWVFNGDTIVLSKSGRLMNGQHRLMAIIESDISLVCLVVRGVDDGAIHTIDNNRPRTFADWLCIMDTRYYVQSASVTRLVLLWERGRLDLIRKSRISNATLVEVWNRYPDIIDAVRYTFVEHSDLLMLGTPAVLGFMRWRTKRLNTKKSDEFFEKLATGFDLKAGDPVATLRKYLIKVRTSPREDITPSDMLAWFIYAWNAHVRGEDYKHYKRLREGDKFPEIEK